jgi:hypothetical protein
MCDGYTLTIFYNRSTPMLKQIITAGILLLSATLSTAGELKNGIWIASTCGNRQEAPFVNANTLDSYNASVKAINAWQLTAKTYDDCLINEANADSALIAKTATEEQGKLKEIVNKINADLNAGKVQLEQGSTGFK